MIKKAVTKKRDEPAGREVPMVWVGLEDQPVLAANNMIVQFQDDMFTVAFGFANAPVIMGTKAQIERQILAIDAVRVNPVVRMAMTEPVLEKTIKALQSNLKRSREARKKAAK